MAVGGVVLLRLALAGGTSLPPGAAAAVAGLLAVTLGGAYALAPRGYALDAGRLRVERPLASVEIAYGAIRGAGALSEDALAGARRVMGSGGLFGYYGRFWSRRLGAFRLYATRRTGLVVVDTADDRLVLSPDSPERFLEVLHARAPGAAREAGETLAARPVPRRVKLGVAALVALVPLAIAAIVVGVWAFSPVSAGVADGEIRIVRKLAPAAVIDVSQVRRVERLAPALGGCLRRVAGTALPGGIRYGHFRSAELGDVQLYAWRNAGYVQLDTDSGRVVLTPDDPDTFVAQIREAQPRELGPGPPPRG